MGFIYRKVKTKNKNIFKKIFVSNETSTNNFVRSLVLCFRWLSIYPSLLSKSFASCWLFEVNTTVVFIPAPFCSQLEKQCHEKRVVDWWPEVLWDFSHWEDVVCHEEGHVPAARPHTPLTQRTAVSLTIRLDRNKNKDTHIFRSQCNFIV